MKEGKKDIEKIIIDFLKKYKDGKKIPDSEVHALSDKLGIDTHELESHFYALAAKYAAFVGSKNKIPGGAGDIKGTTEDDVDKAEFDVGVKVEMEHTDNKDIAREIALDHLTHNKSYYSELIKAKLVDEKPALKAAKEYGWIKEEGEEPEKKEPKAETKEEEPVKIEETPEETTEVKKEEIKTEGLEENIQNGTRRIKSFGDFIK